MRRTNYPLVVAYIVFILAVLLLAWWIAGDYYKPYPPATPTASPGYWPTRITATIVPSATPTKVVHTPIQPTIGYTATPTVLITIENTPTPENTMTPVPSETPVPVVYAIQKSIECEMMIFRGRLVIYYPYCRIIERRTLATRLPSEDDAIWSPPIPKTPPYPVATFTGSPIFIP